ncbi:P-loop containing nucleoside triphosphate hydrolase protein [Scleroderma citrinum]
MAKKKKTQLKPVVRGFATTSVPKKAAQSSDEIDSTIEPELSPSDMSTTGCLQAPNLQTIVQGATQELCHADREEQLLQNMLVKYMEKTEKGISKTMKAIEVDRRNSRTFFPLPINPIFIDLILQLHLEEEAQEVTNGYLDEPTETAVTRLAVTYGVLRRLGFAEDKVEQCLRAIQGIGLDEAYEWLFVHCPEAELDNCNTGSQQMGKGQQREISGEPQGLFDDVSGIQSSRALPKLEESVPSALLSSNIIIEDSHSVKSNALTNPGSGPSTPASVCSSPEPEDPNLAYAHIKIRIIDLQRMGLTKNNSDRITHLEVRLRKAKAHYFFDEKDAETLYRIERQKADAQLLQAKLRGSLRPPRLEVRGNAIHERAPAKTPEHEAESDFFGEDDDNSSEGMLGLLEAPPNEVQGVGGTTVRVRDMSFVKHGSTKLPKAALMEYVTKIDRHAVVTFNIISGSSRARRAGVWVLWHGKRVDKWLMEEDACHNESQAEQYIATIALHALAFPRTEGFAIIPQTIPGGSTFYRFFPPAFRDLWDELEKTRKDTSNRLNRDIWAKMRSIVEQKLPKKSDSETIVRISSRGTRYGSSVRPNIESNSDRLVADFNERQSRVAYKEMLTHRDSLPIAKYRQQIIDTLEQSQILVLCGETGCGKSTQVPAFILEDQLSRGSPCKIFCTEPRRISALSLAQRVSCELGDPPGAVGTTSSLVGYSIRLENRTNRNTRLVYMTNGVALRMLEGGTGSTSPFDEITHIIIDEVHERNIESDFLLIVLKSLVQSKPDLRIILMSATVDADKFSNYFGGCPILRVPGRTFPVDVRFMEDAVECTGWSISEDSPYAKRFHSKFYKNRSRTDWEDATLLVPDDEDVDDDKALIDEDSSSTATKLEKSYSPQTEKTIKLFDERIIPYEFIVRLLEHICLEDLAMRPYSAAILIFMPGLAEIRRLSELLSEHKLFGDEEWFRIYPLHSTISTENQNAVFDVPPNGTRKIVIGKCSSLILDHTYTLYSATNIAETGITIPDITCVIDSGKQREMMFDEKRQLSRLVETFVAKSNASQRRGRAGRVQNGICFHLFTKLRHDTLLADHPLPEMMRLSLSDLALRIKTMKVKLGDSIEDVLCRAIDPPTPVNIRRAISALVEVKALTPMEDITPMGQLLSTLPSDVHLGKFLLVAVVFRCLDPALTIAAALNSKSPFVKPLGLEQEAEHAKDTFCLGNSDFLTIHNAFSSWRRACTNPGFIRTFCRKNFLSHDNLLQIEELRQQLLGYLVDSSFIHVDTKFMKDLNQARFGRNNSYKPRLVITPPDLNVNSSNLQIVNAALAAGLFPKILSVDSTASEMRTISNNQAAAFHPSSVNFRMRSKDLAVNHLAYYTLMHSKKLYAWETTPVDDLTLLLVCGECDFKLICDSVIVDRRIKYRLTPKANVAMKILRKQLSSILVQQFHGEPLTESQGRWYELAMTVLGGLQQGSGDDTSGTIKVIR